MRYRSIVVAWLWLGIAAVAFPDERPNVLFIAVDDLRAELGCLEDDHVHSPHNDRLSPGDLIGNAPSASIISRVQPAPD
jgi:hypothetical protein